MWPLAAISNVCYKNRLLKKFSILQTFAKCWTNICMVFSLSSHFEQSETCSTKLSKNIYKLNVVIQINTSDKVNACHAVKKRQEKSTTNRVGCIDHFSKLCSLFNIFCIILMDNKRFWVKKSTHYKWCQRKSFILNLIFMKIFIFLFCPFSIWWHYLSCFTQYLPSC